MADSEVAGREWSSTELDLIVADYFAMLQESKLVKPFADALLSDPQRK